MRTVTLTNEQHGYLMGLLMQHETEMHDRAEEFRNEGDDENADERVGKAFAATELLYVLRCAA